MHGIQLIFHLSLKVSSPLLVLPLLPHAVDDHDCHQRPDGHHRAEGANEHHIAAGVAGVGGVGADGVVLRVDGAVGQDLADTAGVVRQADAREGVVAVLAEAAVETGVGIALVHFLRAVFAGESRQAGAGEVIHSVAAGSAVCARQVLAVVVVLLTVPPNEPVLADALVVVDELEADTTILARAGDAVVDDMLAVATLEALVANALVSVHVTVACRLVLAGVIRRADVKVLGELAVGSMEARGAGARVIILDPGLKQSKFMRISVARWVGSERLADIFKPG